MGVRQHIGPMWDRLHTFPHGRTIAMGAAATILIASIWLLMGAGGRRMEPLLDETLAGADAARIAAHLTSKGMTARIEGERVMVAAQSKSEALAELASADLLPGNPQSGFDAMLKQMSIWDTGSKTDWMYNRAREISVQNIIGHYPGVQRATVLIGQPGGQRIGGTASPTATIDIQTKGTVKDLAQLATAAVDAVTGAQFNLVRRRVQVAIDGVPWHSEDRPVAAEAGVQTAKASVTIPPVAVGTADVMVISRSAGSETMAASTLVSHGGPWIAGSVVLAGLLAGLVSARPKRISVIAESDAEEWCFPVTVGDFFADEMGPLEGIGEGARESDGPDLDQNAKAIGLVLAGVAESRRRTPFFAGANQMPAAIAA
jgi:hypothetical protein